MKNNFLRYVKLFLLLISVGTAGGFVGSMFSHSIALVTSLREKNGWILYLIPLVGLIIAWLYRNFAKNTKGTETVLCAISEGKSVPISLGTNMFTATVLTHLVGGSAGREGAALQIGGSLGSAIGNLIKVDSETGKLMILCGMCSVFSALFGTPLTAAVFVSEISSVGFLRYSSLLPCTVSSIVAFFVARLTGVHPERFSVADIPSFSAKNLLYIVLLAFLCSILAYLFCFTFKIFEHSFEKLFKNEYLRILTVGFIIIVFTFFFGTSYCGGSMWIIEESLIGKIPMEAFLLKLLLTAITVAGGFKGGEIVPTLCIGSSFGCTYGMLIGFSPPLCAACGMIALFSGITNCPLSALLLSFELLSGAGFYYTAIASIIAFVLSRYCGLFKVKNLTLSIRHRHKKFNS